MHNKARWLKSVSFISRNVYSLLTRGRRQTNTDKTTWPDLNQTSYGNGEFIFTYVYECQFVENIPAFLAVYGPENKGGYNC